MDIKAGKYFSLLLDCTPDLSYQGQLSLVIQLLKFENNGTTTMNSVEEHFIEFIDISILHALVSHSLNLLVCDAAQYSPIAMTFFGVVQRVYEVFVASTKQWNVLKKHVPDLTVKNPVIQDGKANLKV